MYQARGSGEEASIKYQCAVADAMERRRFSKPSCPARLILFRYATLDEAWDRYRDSGWPEI